MTTSDSDTDELASALHRSILGVPLAMVALIGVGLALRIPSGGYLRGIAGAVLALGAGYWIVSLFAEGVADR